MTWKIGPIAFSQAGPSVTGTFYRVPSRGARAAARPISARTLRADPPPPPPHERRSGGAGGLPGARTSLRGRLPHARALESWLLGVGAAVLVAGLGLSHGGYFATAWGPLTLAFLAVSGVALVVPPRCSSGCASSRSRRSSAVRAVGARVGGLGHAHGGGTGGAARPRLRSGSPRLRARPPAAARRRVPDRALGGHLRRLRRRARRASLPRAVRRVRPDQRLPALGAGRLLERPRRARGVRRPPRAVARGEVGEPRRAAHRGRLDRPARADPLLHVQPRCLARTPRRARRRARARSTTAPAHGHPSRRRPWPALAVLLASRSGRSRRPGHTLASASADGRARRDRRRPGALRRGAAALAAGVAPRVAVSHAPSRSGTSRSRRPRRRIRAHRRRPRWAVADLAVVLRAAPRPARTSTSASSTCPGTGASTAGGSRSTSAEEHPLVGSGGGSYKRYWLAERPYAGSIRDAHSLYVESLAEYGPLGLALVVAIVGVPLGVRCPVPAPPARPRGRGRPRHLRRACRGRLGLGVPGPDARRARRRGRGPGLGDARPPGDVSSRGGSGCSLLVIASSRSRRSSRLGARAEAASADAAADRDYARAATEARRAERLAPWSVEPLLLSGGRRRARATGRRGGDVPARDPPRPGNWRSWYELAAVTRGPERAAALRGARALNPRESLLDELGRAREPHRPFRS